MLCSTRVIKKMFGLLIIAFSCLNASELSVKSVQEIISGESALIGGGFIQNLQVAPFNSDLVSFEVTYDNDATIKLFLFNLKTKNIFQVGSEAYSGGTSKTKRKFYLKDQGLQWHPYKNWFVFYGNGMANRNQIYICRVVVPELINNFAVNGYRIRLEENEKEERSDLIDPAFDMTGDRIVFSRKVEKRDKKSKYNRTYNIAIMNDIFKYKDYKFKDVEFKTVLDKRFDQVMPLCSPSDKDLVAFISYKNQEKKGEDYYAEYSINILNLSTSEVTVIDNLDGYAVYPFKWSNTGSQIFYMKALSLLRTPQSFIDDKLNQVNLHFARIEKKAGKLSVYIQTNPKTDVLLEDVLVTKNSLHFINDNNIIISRYDSNIPTLFLVDINLWRSSDRNYAQRMDFNRDFDADFPVLVGNELYFIATAYPKNKAVSQLTLAEVSIKLSGGEARDVAGRKVEIDSGGYTADEDWDEYSDDDSFDDTAEEPVVPDKKKPQPNQKIQELEKKLSELKTDLSKIDNQIASDQVLVRENENSLRALNRQSNELSEQRSTLLENINQLRALQTEKLKGEKEIALKLTEVTGKKNERLRIEKEILELEKTILTERDVLTQLEGSYSDRNSEIVKLNSLISSLKIEQTRTMQAENKLASFQGQLSELQVKKDKIQSDIDISDKELSDEKMILDQLEKDLSGKKKDIAGLKSQSMQLTSQKTEADKLGKASLMKAKETLLSGYRKDLTKIDADLTALDKKSIEENDNISDLTKKMKELNDSKATLMSEVAQLKEKKADQVKTADLKKEEVKPDKEKPVADKDEYEDDDEYGEDSDIGDDIFEKVETKSSTRRGRR